MRKQKLIEKLYSEIEELRKSQKALYEKMLEREELFEKKSRKKILKDYDVAILVKNHKTYILQKGEEEKRVRSYTLRQDAGSYPILEIEELLY